ncbi:hypothetical protein KP509_19G025800 [Ceratopteris richardii]|uniref:Uncharacterized protein n=1 Tax=Ceratopteris richardii TaxID=49495 RepID=A0A8T2SIY2_CERRI|nr:hypothetical protein KP509_19G025800 [Ceratopteris richardii]
MGRRAQEERGKGWRELAVRAGLMHPSRSALMGVAQRASLGPPRLESFGLASPTTQQGNIFSKSRSPSALFSSVLELDSGVQLSGTHNVGVGMILETFLQGTKVHLDELRLRMSKKLRLPSIKKNMQCDSVDVSLCLASDLQQRNRATIESMIGTREDRHTLSCVLSSDFQSQLARGVASSHRLGNAWTIFTRYSIDDYAGERIILQVVHELNMMNKLSAIFATTHGHCSQGGFSWTYESSNKGIQNSLSFKGLCNGNGDFSVSIKAEYGVV